MDSRYKVILRVRQNSVVVSVIRVREAPSDSFAQIPNRMEIHSKRVTPPNLLERLFGITFQDKIVRARQKARRIAQRKKDQSEVDKVLREFTALSPVDGLLRKDGFVD